MNVNIFYVLIFNFPFEFPSELKFCCEVFTQKYLISLYLVY